MLKIADYLLLMSLMSVLFPPAVAYATIFFILCFYAYEWRSLPQEIDRRKAFGELWSLWHPIWWACFIFALMPLVSSLVSVLWPTPDLMMFRELFGPWSHLLSKRLIVCVLLSVGIDYLYRRGAKVQRILFPLAMFTLAYALYALIQREYGLDLAKGLTARLGQNRMGLNGYRVSGFTGHPVHLSYNLMLLILCLLPILSNTAQRALHSSRLRSASIAIFLALGFILLLSGSRWPFAIIMMLGGIWVCFEFRRFYLQISAGFTLVLIGIFLEGSLWHRLQELRSHELNRFIFWDIHWQLFSDHKIFGTGYLQYKTLLLQSYALTGNAQVVEKYNAHNIYLQTLADGGLVGIFSLVYWGFVQAKVFLRSFVGRTGTGLWLCFLAMILGGLMQNTLRDSTFLYAYWVVINIAMMEARFTGDTKLDTTSRP